MKKYNLNGIWNLEGGKYKADGEIPGSVLSILLEKGLIDDPFYRDNELITLELLDNDFEFSRKFFYTPKSKTTLVCEGLDTLCTLYLNGKKPIVVEMQDDLITTKGICLANTSYLRDFFKTNKVPVYLETSLSEINDGSVTLKDKEGKTFDIAADSVILSVGYNPAPIASKGRHVHVIGDAASVGNLRTVIWGAWNVCMKL